MGARQEAGLAGDRAHGGQVATVDAAAGGDDVAADHFGFQLLEAGLHRGFVGLLLVAQRVHDGGAGGGDGGLAGLLVGVGEGGAHGGLAGGLDRFVERGVVLRHEVERLFRRVLGHVDDQVDHRLHLLMRKVHGAEHLLLGQLVHLGFHHHHGVLGAGDDEVQALVGVVAELLHVLDHRVEDVLVVGVADARAADRAEERRARDGQRGRGGDHGDDVGVVLHVMAQHGADDLRLVVEALDEERPDRTVDQAGGEGLFLGGTRLTLEETAGDLARRVIFFLVVDRQREEIEPRLGRFFIDHGGEHGGLAIGGDDSAAGLTGDFAGLQGQRAAAPFDRLFRDIEHSVSLSGGPAPPGARRVAHPFRMRAPALACVALARGPVGGTLRRGRRAPAGARRRRALRPVCAQADPGARQCAKGAPGSGRAPHELPQRRMPRRAMMTW